MIENNRECYHCNGSHPELLNTLLEWDDVTDPRASQAFKDQVAECTSRWDKDDIPTPTPASVCATASCACRCSRAPYSMTLDGKPGL